MKSKIGKLKTKIRNAAAALTLITAVGQAHADIIGSHTANGDGTVTYSYTINNSAGAFNVSAWSLDFGFAVPDWNQLDIFSGGSVTVPNLHWFAADGTPITGESAQDFLSLDPAGDVATGQALYGFSFTSSFQPGTVEFHEFSADGASISGTTVGPVGAVPEGKGPFELIALAAVVGYGVLTRSSRAKLSVFAGC